MKKKEPENRTKKQKKRTSGSHVTRLRPTRRHKAARAVTVMLVSVFFLGACAAVLLVDHNSRAVGWNQNRTELAFAGTSQEWQVTVLGQRYSIDTNVFTPVRETFSHIKKGTDILRPAPERLADMVYMLFARNAERIHSVLHAAVSDR